MRTIGVRELKAHLSRVLRDVQRGDLYLVTDRGRVVAEIRRPGAAGEAGMSAEEQSRYRMAAAGQLRLAERSDSPFDEPWPPTDVALPDGTAQAILDWLREDK